MPKLKEKGLSKKLGPVLHIYCEGEKTEPIYFNGYIDKHFPGDKTLKVEKTDKNTPIQLVEVAVKAKNSGDNSEDDVYWVVFDRESNNKYPDSKHQKAHQLANNNDINIALSNVCFEVWILLHFQENTAHYANYDDLKKRSDLHKTHIKGYDKGNKKNFTSIENKITEARKNAIGMNKRTQDSADGSRAMPYQWNPYTDVYKLLDAIDAFGA